MSSIIEAMRDTLLALHRMGVVSDATIQEFEEISAPTTDARVP